MHGLEVHRLGHAVGAVIGEVEAGDRAVGVPDHALALGRLGVAALGAGGELVAVDRELGVRRDAGGGRDGSFAC